MECLPPLTIGLLVALSAVAGGGKCAGLNEIIALDGRISWSGESVFTEAKVVTLADRVRVCTMLGWVVQRFRLRPNARRAEGHPTEGE